MKKNLLRLFVLSGMLFTMSATVNAQNSFPATGAAGIGTTTPNASSLLDIQSTTKGILIPRMTQVQRNAIVSPTTGLLIYQTSNTKGFYYYTGTAWTAVSAKGANTTLANLVAPTAVNQSLLPGITGTIDLGSATNTWKDIYASGTVKATNLQMTNGAVAGSVLTSDINGLATWQAPTGGGWGLSGNTGTTIANFMGTTDNHSLRFRTNNTEKVIIDSLGKVGIGMTPTAKFSVAGDGYFTAAVNGEQSLIMANTYSGLSRTFLTSGPNYSALQSDYDMQFNTQGFGPWSTKMILKADGKVGIGTTAPATGSLLEVAGEIRSSGNNATLNLQRTTGANYINYNDANDLIIRSISPTYTNANNRITISPGGNVAIGTIVSSAYKLTVAGKIICTELKVQLMPFPDYVFAKDYNLKSIDEVEQHIKTYSRLPGMPSACEVEENGMSVGEMQGKVVEKVEENTLYIIQLNKENKELKEQLKSIQAQLDLMKK